MRCAICGNGDLSEIEVKVKQEKAVFNTYKANDLKVKDFKKPIKLDPDPLKPPYNSIVSAECALCGNKFGQDELEELSEEINVPFI